VGSVPRTVKTPVLILQLLLENAVSHGIEQLPEGGDIDISVGMGEDEKHLLIEVANPLPAKQWEAGPEHGSALDNIRLRLRDHYGDEASLKIEKDTGRFRVIISHPAWENDQQ
jgi:LytS/YehU family sensor histidine kinase